MMLLFLHVDVPKALSARQGFKDIDWIGNFLLVASLVSILIALTWADTRYPWKSWRIIVPFLVGFAGLAAFHIYEASSFCRHPTIPPRLVRNRTAAIAFATTFFMGVLSTWRTYFVVLYFEGVLVKSAARAGVLLLPAILVYVPASVAGGIFLSKTGRYKPIHLVALLLVVLASGLYIDFNKHSSLAKIVIYQMIAGTGTGILGQLPIPTFSVQSFVSVTKPRFSTLFSRMWHRPNFSKSVLPFPLHKPP